MEEYVERAILCWDLGRIYGGQEPSRNNRVVVPAHCRLHRLTELVPWNRFLGSKKFKNTVSVLCWNLEQSMGARNLVGIGLLYRPTRLHRLAESFPLNQFLGSKKVGKFGICAKICKLLRSQGINSKESILGLLKNLQIQALSSCTTYKCTCTIQYI